VCFCVHVGVSEAARSGYSVLVNGGTALDAVESAVVSMENNPTFNAGEPYPYVYPILLALGLVC